MDGRRDRAIWLILAAGAGLAAALLVTHRTTGFRTSTPEAPSCDRADPRGGASFSPPPRPESPPTAPDPPPPLDEIGLAERRVEELVSRDGEEARRRMDELLASERDPAARAAACRSFRSWSADPRLIARLATETDPVAIPAAVAVLARQPGADARDALVRLVARAGAAGFPDVVDEVLALDDLAVPASLVALAHVCLDGSRVSERERILERLRDSPSLPDGLTSWALREPDPGLRERLESLLSGE